MSTGFFVALAILLFLVTVAVAIVLGRLAPLRTRRIAVVLALAVPPFVVGFFTSPTARWLLAAVWLAALAVGGFWMLRCLHARLRDRLPRLAALCSRERWAGLAKKLWPFRRKAAAAAQAAPAEPPATTPPAPGAAPSSPEGTTPTDARKESDDEGR